MPVPVVVCRMSQNMKVFTLPNQLTVMQSRLQILSYSNVFLWNSKCRITELFSSKSSFYGNAKDAFFCTLVCNTRLIARHQTGLNLSEHPYALQLSIDLVCK